MGKATGLECTPIIEDMDTRPRSDIGRHPLAALIHYAPIPASDLATPSSAFSNRRRTSGSFISPPLRRPL